MQAYSEQSVWLAVQADLYVALEIRTLVDSTWQSLCPKLGRPVPRHACSAWALPT